MEGVFGVSFEAEKKITCCFTGHRPEKLPWGYDESSPDCIALKRQLARALEELYRRGFRHFIGGMAQGCDLYFAEAALALREEHPDLVVEAAIPCPSQSKNWREEDKARYQCILERCNLETVVQQYYTQGCMLRRDRYMVDRSALLLAIYNGSGGGTRYTINYALDRGVEVIQLAV